MTRGHAAASMRVFARCISICVLTITIFSSSLTLTISLSSMSSTTSVFDYVYVSAIDLSQQFPIMWVTDMADVPTNWIEQVELDTIQQ